MMGTDTGKCPVCAGVFDGLVCAHCGYEPTRCPFCDKIVCYLEPDDEWTHIPCIDPCGCMVAFGHANVSEEGVEWIDAAFKDYCLKEVQAHYADCEPGEFEAMSGGATIEDYANDAEPLEMILTENEWLKIARFKTVSRMSAEVQDSPAIMFFVHPQHRDWLQA